MDKQESRTAEEIFTGIETMMFSAFLHGKDGVGNFKQWYERNDMKKLFQSTLESYAQQRVASLEEEVSRLKKENEELRSYYPQK